MPTIRCHLPNCPTILEVPEPLSQGATYTCKNHIAKFEGADENGLVPRCDICEARGCRPENHSKTEIELKAFCRNTIPTRKNHSTDDLSLSSERVEEDSYELASDDGPVEDDYSEESRP